MYPKSPNDTEKSEFLMEVSQAVADRIKSGPEEEEVLLKNENAWIEKVKSIDENHTKENDLDINIADKIVRNLERNVGSAFEEVCPRQKFQLTNCFKQKRGNLLACESSVERFAKCVDEAFYNAVRFNSEDRKKKSELSFLEKFDQSGRF